MEEEEAVEEVLDVAEEDDDDDGEDKFLGQIPDDLSRVPDSKWPLIIPFHKLLAMVEGALASQGKRRWAVPRERNAGCGFPTQLDAVVFAPPQRERGGNPGSVAAAGT